MSRARLNSGFENFLSRYSRTICIKVSSMPLVRIFINYFYLAELRADVCLLRHRERSIEAYQAARTCQRLTRSKLCHAQVLHGPSKSVCIEFAYLLSALVYSCLFRQTPQFPLLYAPKLMNPCVGSHSLQRRTRCRSRISLSSLVQRYSVNHSRPARPDSLLIRFCRTRLAPYFIIRPFKGLGVFSDVLYCSCIGRRNDFGTLCRHFR
jgi:hypothetical protein